VTDPDSPPPVFDAEAFRARVRRFLEAEAPALPFRTGTRSPESDEEAAVLRAWSRELYAQGFEGAHWPVEHGGRADHDPLEEFIVSEELSRARAPVPIGAGALAAHALLAFGTDEQRTRYLPRIRSFDDVWCQLFSEPDAGSDLASMRTAAVPDGDHFVVSGQKVWSTNAFFAEMGYLLARTDPTVSKHAGISAFALDMSLPGITTRPLREMTGTSDFNEVFFDEVRVPASALIGPLNDGWRVATDSLAQERAGVGALVIRLRQNLDALVELAGRTSMGAGTAAQHATVRQQLAAFHCRVEIATLLSQATMGRRARGQFREADVPLSKLSFAMLNWDLADAGVTLQGPPGMLAQGELEAADHGRWQDELLYAKAYTISGGSNEIMRNLLSERGLGLPREPKPA
jgi:alkylation response protein AidB-like acyl-CoA dehydrogenase